MLISLLTGDVAFANLAEARCMTPRMTRWHDHARQEMGKLPLSDRPRRGGVKPEHPGRRLPRNRDSAEGSETPSELNGTWKFRRNLPELIREMKEGWDDL